MGHGEIALALKIGYPQYADKEKLSVFVANAMARIRKRNLSWLTWERNEDGRWRYRKKEDV